MTHRILIRLLPFALALLLLAACRAKAAPSPTIGADGDVPTNSALPTISPTPVGADSAVPTNGVRPTPTASPPPDITVPTSSAIPTTPPTASATETLPAPTAAAPATASATPEVSPTSPPPASTAAAPAACKDQATFVDDVTIPDDTLVRQGESFIKTWRVLNSGECAWDGAYSLVFSGGEVFNAPLANPLPAAAPGEMVDISVSMTAPPRGGTYVSNWEFQNPAGERFGVGFTGSGPLWARVAVAFYIPPGENPQGDTGGAGGSAGGSAGGGAAAPTPEPVSAACPATRDTSAESIILSSINQARQQNGLDALSLSSQLTAAALAHSTDMACNGIVSHTGSDGTSWYDRVSAQGYANYNSARENIYVGNPAFGGDANGAFNWWWNSPIHHDNMLNPTVSEIGIAYVFNPQSEYGGYYTTVFARP